ncbi:helix-turn-helix transcriptional regulator [Xanthomonas sp. AmX2]|uniref:helix-turn-helix domain-containing protein n=1 Tax=Xanthomonas sp. TaxID=29446 RepID=UPI001981033D|nr:AraC family transcriptional regulator [Xanthomonas sp.]MBN6150241.1 helix-turn-helix transcriptional regulator [Xanthomonas sp.]
MPTLVDQVSRQTPLPPNSLLSSADGSIALVRHSFAASDGPMGHPTQLRLALALGGGGRLYQCTNTGELDAHWQVGQFNVVPPAVTGTYSSPPVEVLGLAVEWAAVEAEPGVGDFVALANGLYRDPVVTSVLQALWSVGAAGILSDSYLVEGARVIVRRLGHLAARPALSARSMRPLSSEQLSALERFIDSHWGSRPDVTAMAAALGIEVTRFGRALRAATGVSPYVFLTHRRMHWARVQLASGCRVTEVAQATGYTNVSKFAAAFRRVTGTSPSACGGGEAARLQTAENPLAPAARCLKHP